MLRKQVVLTILWLGLSANLIVHSVALAALEITGAAIGAGAATPSSINSTFAKNTGNLLFAVNGEIISTSWEEDKNGTNSTVFFVKVRDDVTKEIYDVLFLDPEYQDILRKHSNEKSNKALIYYYINNNTNIAKCLYFKEYKFSSEFNINIYKNEFNEAFSSTELVEFINKYEKEDPHKLIPKAYALLDKAHERQKIKDPYAISKQLYRDFFAKIKTDIDRTNFIKLYENNDPDGLIAKTEFKLSESQKLEVAEIKARELEQYRDNFKNASSSADFEKFISTYQSHDPDQLVSSAKKKLVEARKREAAEAKARELQQYREAFKNASSSADFEKFISTYQSHEPDQLISSAKKKLVEARKREAAEAKARALQQYREAFKNARSSSDFRNFIQTYQGKDPDKLIAKAMKIKAEAERREAAERAEAERQEQYRREHACDHVYIGKVFSGKSAWGLPLRLKVEGFSAKTRRVTIYNMTSGQYEDDLTCYDVPQ